MTTRDTPTASAEAMALSAPDAVVERTDRDPSAARRRLVAASAGTFVEWYDFLVYGLTAPLLAHHFFPDSTPTVALLSTLAIFAVAFFVRPLGGMFFGYLGDRHGRIRVLSTTILMMGGATVLIGLLPTYASIGVLAPALLLVCRLIQGLAVGGEHSGSFIYVLESAPSDRRANWIGIVFSASNLPVAFMGAAILSLRWIMGDDAYENWGWRLPFLLGGVLAGVGLWLRMKLTDPEVFEAAAREAGESNPVKAVFTRNLGSFLRVLGLVTPMLIVSYLLITYMYTFLTTTVTMDEVPAMLSVSTAALVVTVLLPFGGLLADRVGRKPVMTTALLWMVVTAYPALVLVKHGSFAAAVAGQLALGMGVIAYVPACLTTMLELFRTTERFTGHAMGHTIGSAFFGGTTPLVAGALVSGYGPLAPAFYVSAAAILGLLVVRFTPETRSVDLLDGAAGASR